MIDILIGAVIILSVFIGILFITIGDLKREIKEINSIQRVQDEEILILMKNHLHTQSKISQHTEILEHLTDQDPLIGKQKVLYPTIVGKA